jgi:hypothetical protein
MKTTIYRFTDPESYHPDVAANEVNGPVSDLLPRLLIIRLDLVFRCTDRGDAEEAIRRLEGDICQAYCTATQPWTARV